MPRPKKASAGPPPLTYFALLEDPGLRKQVTEFIEQVEFPNKRGPAYEGILKFIEETKDAKYLTEEQKAARHVYAGKKAAKLGAKAKRVTAVKKHIAKAASKKHH